MTQEQWSKVVSIILSALIAIAAVFGYNIFVAQPQFAAINEQLGAATVQGQLEQLAGSRAVNAGDYIESLWVDKEFTSAGTNTFTGPLQGASPLVLEGATANAYETTFAVTDPTADRTVTFPNMTGYAMLGAAAGKYITGVNTITGTLTLTHGLTTPQAVFCTLLQDSEANAASCTATISGSTVVVKTWKADGATAGSVGKLVSWMVTGQP